MFFSLRHFSWYVSNSVIHEGNTDDHYAMMINYENTVIIYNNLEFVPLFKLSVHFSVRCILNWQAIQKRILHQHWIHIPANFGKFDKYLCFLLFHPSTVFG